MICFNYVDVIKDLHKDISLLDLILTKVDYKSILACRRKGDTFRIRQYFNLFYTDSDYSMKTNEKIFPKLEESDYKLVIYKEGDNLKDLFIQIEKHYGDMTGLEINIQLYDKTLKLIKTIDPLEINPLLLIEEVDPKYSEEILN